MPSKYGFSTEERDARLRAERARIAEERKLAEEENRKLTAFLARPVAPENKKTEMTREERRSNIVYNLQRVMDDFKRATEIDFSFREYRIEWVGDDPILHMASNRDDWYRLSWNLQDQLLKTISKHTRAKVTIRIDGWNPTSAALFDL